MHVPSPAPGAPDPGASMPSPAYPGVTGLDGEESSTGQKPVVELEVTYEEDIPSDGTGPQGEPEIRDVPARTEISPVPDHLKKLKR